APPGGSGYAPPPTPSSGSG
ncbi:hypothetical protein, partial [Mycobacterium tuberculosis]